MTRGPAHLRKKTRIWWHQVMESYVLEPHHVRLLTLACEAWDRGQEARESLDKTGLIFIDKHGNPRNRPEIAIERDSRIAFARLLRELSLDIIPPPEQRPPMIRGLADLSLKRR